MQGIHITIRQWLTGKVIDFKAKIKVQDIKQRVEQPIAIIAMMMSERASE
jgi:hypothetical protein